MARTKKTKDETVAKKVVKAPAKASKTAAKKPAAVATKAVPKKTTVATAKAEPVTVPKTKTTRGTTIAKTKTVAKKMPATKAKVARPRAAKAEPKPQLIASKATIIPKAPATKKAAPERVASPPVQPKAAVTVLPETTKPAKPRRVKQPAVVASSTRQSVKVPRVGTALPAAPVVSGKPRRRWLRAIVLMATILTLAIAGGYFYQRHKQVPAASADAQLIQEISQRVLLPTNEKPSVSTVVNADKVNQPFLTGSRNGDKVLLYFQTGKAVVYRPSTHQVINMGALQEPQARVFIRKGDPAANVSKVASTIAATNDYTLTSQDVSPNKGYAKTVVVDVAGNRPDIAGKLAQLLHATVVPLPAGETPPDADMLIIVGSDNL